MYSVLSGIFASLASISGKFAMGYDDALWLCEVFTTTLTEMIGSSKLPCQQVSFREKKKDNSRHFAALLLNIAPVLHSRYHFVSPLPLSNESKNTIKSMLWV